MVTVLDYIGIYCACLVLCSPLIFRLISRPRVAWLVISGLTFLAGLAWYVGFTLDHAFGHLFFAKGMFLATGVILFYLFLSLPEKADECEEEE